MLKHVSNQVNPRIRLTRPNERTIDVVDNPSPMLRRPPVRSSATSTAQSTPYRVCAVHGYGAGTGRYRTRSTHQARAAIHQSDGPHHRWHSGVGWAHFQPLWQKICRVQKTDKTRFRPSETAGLLNLKETPKARWTGLLPLAPSQYLADLRTLRSAGVDRGSLASFGRWNLNTLKVAGIAGVGAIVIGAALLVLNGRRS